MMTTAVRDQTTAEPLLGTVGETMTGETVLLAADAPAEAALRRLVHRAISGAPVVDRGRVVGVVTEEPITARPDWSLAQAVRAMIDNGVNRLPVVDQTNRPLGVMTRHDVLRAVAKRTRPRPGPVGAPGTQNDCRAGAGC
jgi:CBS domain-containing protein